MNRYQEWKRKRKMTSSPLSSSSSIEDPSSKVVENHDDGIRFPQFSMLSDDIVVHTFSFLVEAPYRKGTSGM